MGSWEFLAMLAFPPVATLVAAGHSLRSSRLRPVCGAAIASMFFVACTDSSGRLFDVVVSGGDQTFTAPRDSAIEEANERAGFEVRYLDDERFELQAIALQDDANGVRESVRRAEHLYSNRAINREGALPAIMIIEWTGRQEPLSGGRVNEPDPVPVNSAVPGLELLRVDVEGAEAFTAYFGATTSHIIFYDPAPADVLEIFEAHFRN